MSTSRAEKTRHRLIQAAAELFVERGYHGAGLEAVADRAKVTRQTVYNLFGSKGGLLAAVAAHFEDEAGLPALLGNVMSQTDGLAMLRAMLDTVVAVEPKVRPHSRAVYAARLDDETAAALWKNRMGSRLMGMTMVVNRLNADGLLRHDISISEAADIVWSLTSPHQFEYLVIEREWSLERYREYLEDVITREVLKPSATT